MLKLLAEKENIFGYWKTDLRTFVILEFCNFQFD